MQSLYSYATATADTVLLGKFPSCLCFLALRIKQNVTEGNTDVLVSMTSNVAALLPSDLIALTLSISIVFKLKTTS